MRNKVYHRSDNKKNQNLMRKPVCD